MPSMLEILGLALGVTILLAIFCWAIGLCRWHARQREHLIEIFLVLLGLIQELQLHRGLSGALLDDRRDFRGELEANEYKLLRSLNSVGERYGKRQQVFRDQRWRIVLGRWEALRNNWRSLTFETSIFAHGEVISELIGILTSLAQANSKLLGERYVRCATEWPPLIEHLGLLRAMGLHLLGHRPTEEDQLQTDKIAAQLNAGRARLRQIVDGGVDHSLVIRTERAFHRISWLLDGNAERYHAFTFYEEITIVIDEWHALLRHRLHEAAPRDSVARRLVTILRPHPKTG